LSLFDNISRNDQRPQRNYEGDYAYLNLSGRQVAVGIRDVLEDWFFRYPGREQDEFQRRFRSDDNNTHRAAFFELFLHELLIRLNCRIEIHPEVGRGPDKHPDFLVEDKDGNRFYMEAVLATCVSREDLGQSTMHDFLCDELNKRVRSPNYHVRMTIYGIFDKLPSVKRISVFLQEHIERTNPDELVERTRTAGYNTLPNWLYSCGDGIIEFSPFPRWPHLRDIPNLRPVGPPSHMKVTLESEQVRAIRHALVRKANRYGKIDLPFVISLNVPREPLEPLVFVQALFGGYAVARSFTRIRLRRKLDAGHPDPEGAWINRAGPRYTRVSGVLAASHLSPWTIASVPVGLYPNPWAIKPSPPVLARFPQAVAEVGCHISWLDGESSGAILGVAAAQA